MILNKWEKRICEITFKKGLSHLSSCLTAFRLIDNIYKVKKDNEPFILDNGHAGLALYVALEKWYFKNAEDLLEKHGIHPNRDMENKIWASTGSLGQGLPIAVGMAFANRDRSVYALTSDGAMAEGSNWEALRIAGEYQLENLRVTVNANGHTAYKNADPELLDLRMQYFYPSLVARTSLLDQPDWVQGVAGHYVTMDEERYKEITRDG